MNKILNLIATHSKIALSLALAVAAGAAARPVFGWVKSALSREATNYCHRGIFRRDSGGKCPRPPAPTGWDSARYSAEVADIPIPLTRNENYAMTAGGADSFTPAPTRGGESPLRQNRRGRWIKWFGALGTFGGVVTAVQFFADVGSDVADAVCKIV